MPNVEKNTEEINPAAIDPEAGMAEIRERVVNSTILAITGFGFPALFFSILRIREVGWQNIMAAHAGLFILFMAAAVLRRRLPYSFKAGLILTAGILMGLGGVYAWGLVGAGFLMLLSSTTLATLLFGARVGIWTAAMTFTPTCLIGMGVISGTIRFSFDLGQYALSPEAWVNTVAAYGLLVAIIVACLGLIHRTLQNNIRDLSSQAGELFAGNRELVREIERREEVQEALSASEERYRSILESMQEGYYEVDMTGKLTFFNPATAKLYGYPEEELEGMDYRNYMTSETAAMVFNEFNKVYSTGKPVTIARYDVVRKDGRALAVETSVSLMKDAAGNATGFRGVARDVSAQIAVEKLREKLVQVQRWEAIGTLAGGVAHDFNNLLMGIQGNISLMLLNMDGDDPRYEKLINIEEYVKAAAGLTGQLLGLARGGKYEILPTSMNEMVRKTATMFGRTKKELEVVFDLEETPAVEVDRGQMEQLLLNLYVNAWQAMPGGGVLHISVKSRELDQAFVAPYSLEPGKFVQISVRDTGVGMDEKTLARVFDPFFTTKDLSRGTGLGLASAYGIATNHGGFMKASSQVDVGSVFEIYLPASPERAVPVDRPSPEVVYGAETVLLVDDEEIVLKTGSEILETLGYRVITAEGGERALELARENAHGIDLVVLDMIMPGIQGGEVFDRLKEINPGFKVLLSSGYSLNGQATDIMARGCDGFLQKPFNLEELSQKLREVLDPKKDESDPFAQ